jgi:FkbM family methyltransferase
MQVVAAGVHNSLGRALAQAGNRNSAFTHFEKAIRLGAPTSDTRLITQARAGEQLVQLGLSPRVNQFGEISLENPRADTAIEFSPDTRFQESPIPVEMFFSDNDEDRKKSLDELKKSILQSSVTVNLPDLAWVFVSHRNKKFFFAHFAEDYIPGKMAEKNLFYEAPFLNLLARLYQPGKLIIDGGANIGNHSIFFAGVMGAPVIAFEPQPHNFTFLLSNVCLNHLQNKIDVRRTAIGDRVGQVELAQAISNNYGTFTSDMSLVQGGEDPGDGVKKFEVNISPLDDELANFCHMVSIIKLDLEGMELSALLGAKQIIIESMPVIAVECFTKSIYQSVKDFLATFDYFVIDSTNATPTFIFLSRKNPAHLEKLAKYLETSSVGKFSSNKSFNENSE